MSERGYICLDRGALNHEFFRRKEHSEFEAWVWMLTEAAWKPRVRRIGEFMVSLARGELVVSIRHLMRTWSWSQGKVDRFIARLKNEAMVDTRTDTGITIITICNYNKYQLGVPEMDTSSDTGADTEPGHQRIQEQIRGRDTGGYTLGYNTETIKQLNKESIGAIAPLVGLEQGEAKRPSKQRYSEEFEGNFWKPFPRTPIMSKKEAWREWMKLDPAQRALACRAIEPYKRHLKQNPTLNAVHACRFLSQNRAEGILEIAAEKPAFDIRSSLV